jgi:hypothetical protein
MFGRRSYLEEQNEVLIRTLRKALDDSQALNARLADGLDRVLVHKFDPPLKPRETEQLVREPIFGGDIGDVLSVEDDGEFVERMERLTQ